MKLALPACLHNACAATQAASAHAAGAPGFWYGLWHGLIFPLAWMGLFIWLAVKANWPEGYGFEGVCVYRGCLTEAIIRSPVLLQHPTPYSVALFAWFAVTGAAIAGTVLYFVTQKPTTKSLFSLTVIVLLLAVLILSPVSKWDL